MTDVTPTMKTISQRILQVWGVIKGKNWDRAINTDKSMLAAIERLGYDKYIETYELSPSESSLVEVLSSADVTGHIAKY